MITVTKQFVPIKITGLNAQASVPSGQGALQDVVLTLSETTDYEWASLFNSLWSQHFYMMKRRAEVSGGELVVTCMPEELEEGLLSELKKVVSNTNTTFAAAVAQFQAENAQKKATEAANKQNLAQLANKLNFD